MKRLLWLSDSPTTNTGYATISRNILNRLSDEYECHYLAHNYIGQSLPPGLTFKDGQRLNFWVHGNGREPYQKDLIPTRIKELRPAIFCTLLDTFMVYPWMAEMQFSPAQSVFYFPSDGGGGLPQDCDRVLKNMRVSVAMSRYAQEQARKLHGIQAEYIPHAVDTHLYRPLERLEKERCRQELEVVSVSGARMKGFLQGKFVVGCVARNQPRKMLDRSLKAFAEFCRDKPEAVFLFHADMTDAAAGFDMRSLIVRLRLENRVVFTTMRFFDNFEYSEMNKVYNVMDVFFLSTSGEGFGIPTLEAMSAGIPPVVTDYTTTQELLVEDGICGVPVPLVDEAEGSKEYGELTGTWSVERGVMSIPKARDILNRLYHSPALREELGRAGREKAVLLYDWDVVIKDWRSLFHRLSS